MKLPINQIKRISFREDINTLRAIAVLGVLIYHSKIGIFKSGYLGVDVFFVISGYLISNIIIAELNNNTFRFRNFYLRRVKRILPALFLTLLLTLLPSYFLFYPKAFREYTDSLTSTLFFYSNYYFKSLDFYNAEPTQFMPLLHTWSLSVEEQFYIAFPLLVYLIYRFYQKYFLYLIIIFFTTSLYLNTLSIDFEKFYNLEYRSWQLLLGTLAMIVASFYRFKYIDVIGYLSIIFSFIYFDENWLLNIEPRILSSFGVFCVLVSKSRKSNFLHNNLFKFIGLSSFSLYLFHQPLFAYFRYFEKVVNWQEVKSDIDVSVKFLLILFLLPFSYLSYKYLEKPFIDNFDLKKKIFLTVSFMTILIFALNSDTLLNLKYRNVEASYKITNYGDVDRNVARQDGKICPDRSIVNTCIFNKGSDIKVVLLGDSHAITLSEYLSKNLQDYELYILTGDACLYIYGKQPQGICDNKEKSEFDDFVLSFENSIYIYVGNIYSPDYSIQYDLEIDIPRTIDLLVEKNNSVILIEQIPKFPFSVITQYYDGVNWGDTISFKYDDWIYDERKIFTDKIYKTITNENTYKISSEKIFCDSIVKDECVGAFKDQVFYYDDNHISIDGANLIGQEIIKKINQIQK